MQVHEVLLISKQVNFAPEQKDGVKLPNKMSDIT